MSYNYETEITDILTPEGMPLILHAKSCIDAAIMNTGAIRYQECFQFVKFGNSWAMLACLDYLVKLGYYHKIPGPGGRAQDQILVLKDQ